MKKKIPKGNLFVRCCPRRVHTILAWVSHYILLPRVTAIFFITTNFFFVENFLADSDADSNGQKDAVQNKDERRDNKGLSVAFDPSAGAPEEAPPPGKV